MTDLDAFMDNGNVIPAKADKSASPPGPTIRALSAANLAKTAFTPLMEAVRGLIVEGFTLLCGASKIGKSWFVLFMCLCVSAGLPFLGRETTPGAVLYLAFEDSERRLQYRLKRLGMEPPENLFFDTQVLSLADGLLEALNAWVIQHPDAKLIVIDTLQKIRDAAPSRANAYALDYATISELKAFADQHHIAVVAVHHLNKMRDTEDLFDKISGSTGLMGAADTAIIISRKRDSDAAEVKFTGRDVWGDDFQMRFDDGVWKVISAEQQSREAYEAAPIVQAIKAFVALPTFDGRHSIAYEDFRMWAAKEQRLFIGSNAQAVRKAVEPFARQFGVFDGINFAFDKRVGTRIGMTITQISRR